MAYRAHVLFKAFNVNPHVSAHEASGPDIACVNCGHITLLVQAKSQHKQS
jgi:hypothetical protein